MKEHTWEIETVDGGAVGSDDFYICRACGTSGGAIWFKNKTLFLACGCGIKMPKDCNNAKKLIDEHLPLCPHKKPKVPVCKHGEVIWDPVEVEYNHDGSAEISQQGTCQDCKKVVEVDYSPGKIQETI